MNDYETIRHRIVKSLANDTLNAQCEKIEKEGTDEEKHYMDTILNPNKYPLVLKLSDCTCPPDGEASCEINCLFDAIKRDENGKLTITSECVGCGRCIENCDNHILVGRTDVVPLMEVLKKREAPVYAMIAPAFSGQFSEEVTSGKLRSAFKLMGFYGMLEVALFADILTLKEALEFDRSIHDDKDFMLTSCCCPMWVALIKKKYSSLIPHVPPSVSPMVACGRSIKKIHPEAKTVFIGPCIAKKSESREADITDAVDYVLTFQEVAELFEIIGINPADMPEDSSDQSSKAGRIYARTSGVSEAVLSTLNRMSPGRKVPLVAAQADGIIKCKELLKDISDGDIHANFIEGMGCKGGCVGGPKSLIPADEANEHVNKYGAAASCKTPVDNPYVIDILHRLGYDTIESLLDRDNTFTRIFIQKEIL
jgi:iron only hydrogenase large subunit-like protein